MMYEGIHKLIDKTISKLRIETLYIDRGEYEDITKEYISDCIEDLISAKSRLTNLDYIIKHGIGDVTV